MSTPSSPGIPPPPPPPAGAGWPATTPPAAALPTTPFSERYAPEALALRLPWRFLALLFQGLGLLLVFLGTVVMVAFGYIPVNCVAATTCSQSTLQGVLYGIDTARLLWTIGLFGLAVGAGLHLQFRPAPSFPSTPEETRVYLARRRGEFIMLALALLLLFLLMLYSSFAVPYP